MIEGSAVLPVVDIGNILLISSLVISALSSARALYLSFLLISSSVLLLVYGYITSDFSLASIYSSSDINTPIAYKISGLLSTSEGSMLFFTWLICLYRTIYLKFVNIEKSYKQVTLEIQSIIYFLFLLFVLIASNPFQKNILVTEQGLGLNPLLQDVAFTIHPPILYIGYVGISIIFSMAIAYCYKPNVNLAQAMRPWVLSSWSFLTLGIGLGSWWAYRELGWGGFWFWDPVENISLIPWLLTLALLHAISAATKYHILDRWLVFLSMITFVISIIDTFITRSGLLNSVHSFADGSDQIYYMLILVVIISCGSLLSYVIFYRSYQDNSPHAVSLLSCETSILLSNFFLVISAIAVFIGIIYPILNEYFNENALILTPSYYNAVLSKILIPFLCLWIIGPQLMMRKHVVIKNIIASALSFIIAIILCDNNFLLLFLTFWLIFSILISYFYKIQLFTIPLSSSLQLAYNLHKSYYAMLLAHIGSAAFILGILFFVQFSLEKEQYMNINDVISIGKYDVKLEKVFIKEENNYNALTAQFNVNNSLYLTPEIRFYTTEDQSAAEAAIQHDFLSDLYIVISEIDEKLGLGVQVHYNSCINLIWLGIILTFLGGIIGMTRNNNSSSSVRL